MVQVLEAPESFGTEFARSITQGVREGYESGTARKQAMAALARENAQIKKETGIDLSGITDQKIREQAFKTAIEGQHKEKLLNKKQEFLSNILGGNKGQTNQQVNQGQSNKQSEGPSEGGFNPLEISDADIARATAVDSNLGRSLRDAKNTALSERRSNREFELKEKKTSPEFQRGQRLQSAQAQADVKYNQELQTASRQHQLKSQSLDRLDKLNKEGVTGKPFEKLLEKAGLVALTSEGRREFAADVKHLITDIRSILGAQFSQFEFQTILNAYPSADFSKEANDSIIKNLKEFQDIRGKEFEFAKEIKKQNGGVLPEDFQSRVNDMVMEYAQSKLPEIKANTQKIMNEEYGVKPGFVLLFDQSGEPLHVPEDRVDEVLQKGATIP